ncbi:MULTISPECIES: copper resistance protein D [unclassified Leptospira]|uniref:copper resistance protein D n=1 Tax=unclassified Leptospira TaxID=2633828 RepID=UPI0002BF54E4|nr:MULTISPECIES: copper resistance protein D [unclassified Leptospira]EMK00871.1 copper resistance protein D [Leptospira sp. B5-022]MCR1794212.1 copper resistance protein CopD [Leptospira sp. id769339]
MYFIALLFHFFAAAFWVGGMLFFVLIFRPVYKDKELSDVKTILLLKIALQFRKLSYYVFIILIGSGISIAYLKEYFEAYSLISYWISPHGRIFLIKMILFLLLLLSSVLHDFLIGPTAFKEMEKGVRSDSRSRKFASIFGRINLLISLLIAVLGLAYSRGFTF